MLNLTLTITAAPELLEAMSTFTNTITAVKLVTIPQNISSKEQKADAYKERVSEPIYPVQSQQQANTQMAAAIQATAQSYTMEQLAVAATQLMDAGRRNELVTLLGTFGVQALTALPKEQYGAFATQLRALGVKI